MPTESARLVHGGLPIKSRRVLQALPLTAGATLCAALMAPPQWERFLVGLALVQLVSMTGMGIFLARRAVDNIAQQMRLNKEAESNRNQTMELFALTDMLQAAEDHEDAGAILEASAIRLLPDFGGALYVFNNSRDRLDLAKSWNTGDGFSPGATLVPSNCWALKRGKPHINDPASNTLCCMHHIGTAATVEVPMMARGQVHGLLMLSHQDHDAYHQLFEVRRLARALADSMSLALSNITLRETLRTQSLRDPLTGLYNRRYMEDALERYISLAERNGNPTSVVMLDLDNFKKLNDQSGHAKGDAVLRDVAGQLVAALRPSDVVCRYGGEELVIVLPNCGLDDATIKAETLRARVESLSEAHGIPISASFGVASVPATATSPVDVIPNADAALYAAKNAGKNCVVQADRRGSTGPFEETGPRLAIG